MPKVHRHGDKRVCKATTVVIGQSSVYANGKLIADKGDPNTHLKGGLNASINPGTIFIEGTLLDRDNLPSKFKYYE